MASPTPATYTCLNILLSPFLPERAEFLYFLWHLPSHHGEILPGWCSSSSSRNWVGLCLPGWAAGVCRKFLNSLGTSSWAICMSPTLFCISDPNLLFFLNSWYRFLPLSNFFPQRCGSIKFRISGRQKDVPSPVLKCLSHCPEGRSGSGSAWQPPPRSICHFWSRAWFQVPPQMTSPVLCRMTTVLGLHTLFPGMCPGVVVVLLVIHHQL